MTLSFTDRKIYCSIAELLACICVECYVIFKAFAVIMTGVTIDSGKKYSQTVKQAFHVSMAALDLNGSKCYDI